MGLCGLLCSGSCLSLPVIHGHSPQPIPCTSHTWLPPDMSVCPHFPFSSSSYSPQQGTTCSSSRQHLNMASSGKSNSRLKLVLIVYSTLSCMYSTTTLRETLQLFFYSSPPPTSRLEHLWGQGPMLFAGHCLCGPLNSEHTQRACVSPYQMHQCGIGLWDYSCPKLSRTNVPYG
jgi:hypothetical protein